MTKTKKPAAATPEVIVSPQPSSVVHAPSHAVRAEITFADGCVKVFTGASQDSEIDLSSING